MTLPKKIVAWLLLPAGVYAQANLATITGVVTDTANAVMPGVSLTVRNADTNLARSAKSTPSGDHH